MAIRPTLDISFPSLPGGVNLGSGALERVRDGIFVKTIGGLRLSMIQDVPLVGQTSGTGTPEDEDGYRVQVINNVPLGKDEKVYLSRQITFDVVDPYDPNFTRVRDSAVLDLVIDVLADPSRRRNGSTAPRASQPAAEYSAQDNSPLRRAVPAVPNESGSVHAPDSTMKSMLSNLLSSVSALMRDDPDEEAPLRLSLPATIPTGVGAAPLPDVEDASTMSIFGNPSTSRLSWSSIYFAGELCTERILRDIAQTHEVLVIKRGGCTFSQKMRNIAAFRPGRSSLKLVIVVSYDEDPATANPGSEQGPGAESDSIPVAPLAALRAEGSLIRPHLDEAQMTASGIPRNNPLSMVMVGGGDETYALLQVASGVGIKRRFTMRSRGVPITNLYII
jgi:hypothetical protein